MAVNLFVELFEYFSKIAHIKMVFLYPFFQVFHAVAFEPEPILNFTNTPIVTLCHPPKRINLFRYRLETILVAI